MVEGAGDRGDGGRDPRGGGGGYDGGGERHGESEEAAGRGRWGGGGSHGGWSDGDLVGRSRRVGAASPLCQSLSRFTKKKKKEEEKIAFGGDTTPKWAMAVLGVWFVRGAPSFAQLNGSLNHCLALIATLTALANAYAYNSNFNFF